MRRLIDEDSGMTLIEVSLSWLLLFVVLVFVSGLLVSAQESTGRQQVLTASNDEAREAMEQLDRELRSANFILTLDPHTLLAHTQSNANEFGLRCVQWTVTGSDLLRRTWPSGDSASASDWQIVATDLANVALNVPTFVLPTAASNRVSTGGRSVNTMLLVNPDPANDPDATVALRQTLSGRNITAGAPAQSAVWPPTTPPSPCQVLP